MAKQTINIGSVPNDGTGSTLRDGGDLINDNFNEIYTAIGDGTTITAGTFLTDSNSVAVTNKTFNSTNTFPTISFIDDTSTTQSISLGGSFRFIGGSGITTTISGNTITFDTDGSIVTETSSDVLENKTISGLNNTLSNIGNASLTNSSITLIDDTSTTDAVSLGESLRLTGGTGITSVVGSNQVTFNIDSSVATLTGSQELTNKTINASSNTISNIVNANLSGSAAISNANLANPNITLGVDTINLGATASTITDLNLDGSSSLSGTGTVSTTGASNRLRFNFAGFGSLPTAATYEGMFAYDTTGQRPYVADSGGWVRLLDENSSVSSHADVNTTGIADEEILIWSSAQARFNAIPQKINGAAEIDVTNSGSSAYLFNSHYTGNNPDIYVRAGATYAFKLNVSGHPFHLQTVSGAYSSGNSYTTGLTHIADDGTVTTGASALLKEEGTLYYEIPSGTSGTIYYACQYHSGMAGSITIQSDTTAAGVSFTTDKSNTGDGSTTAFTINAGRDVDDILVIVNGIVLTPTDDYTVSGTTLTFTSAPAASAGIVIRYLG